jgi:hypothetical protein
MVCIKLPFTGSIGLGFSLISIDFKLAPLRKDYLVWLALDEIPVAFKFGVELLD